MEKLYITEASKIVKCHPETLRRLERRGLLNAQRDYRGFRVFNLNDLLGLKRKRERLDDLET